jgi:Flp pilus assembly protein CpaB
MEVDQVNGVGTLIVPNDRVDVILSVWLPEVKVDYWACVVCGSKKPDKRELTLGNDVTTKMVIQNRKVLLTLLPQPGEEKGVTGVTTGVGGGGAASPTPKPKATTETISNSGQHMLVVLEVKRDEAEIIRWAQREEKMEEQNYISLGLVLRSDKDNDAALTTTPGITFRQLVTMYGVLPPDFRGAIPPDLLKLMTW